MDTYFKHRTATLSDALAMLSYIPAHDRETWVLIGMALKAEFGDEGFEPFDNWSQSSYKYEARSVKDVWKSFKSEGITFASLSKLAIEAGYCASTRKPPVAFIPTLGPPKPNSDTSIYAKKLFLACERGDIFLAKHEYSRKKGIDWAAGAGRGKASGKLIGKDADCIIVPVRNIQATKVQGVQCINVDGVKQSFGSISGGSLLLGNTLNRKATWFVAEGWASAVSTVFHLGEEVCACAFGKGNMEKVAKQIAAYYSPDQIIILKEQD
jgi:hypothetical protein